MRLFVTGGAGYVGSHCVRRLVAAGHHVTVYDNLSFGHRAALDPAAAFVEGDLGDSDKLFDVLATGGFDGVLHFAAFLNVGESVTKPLMYWRNNVANTMNLLEAMERAAIKRLVFSSTCAVYGEPDKLPLTEDLPRKPINPYGATKLAVELMLSDCAGAWGLGSIALRYFNASGAAADGTIGEDHHPETHLIPVVLQVALGQRANIAIFGTDYPTPDGTCVRDYIHVDDLAEAHLRAIQAIEPGRTEAYNVGTGRGQSVRDVIEVCRKVTGHAIPVVERPRRPGDPPALFADPARIKSRLDWVARHGELTDVISSAWKWHNAHPHGFVKST